MPEPHRDTGTQMRRLHPSPTGPHPYPWTQPIQHQGTSIVSQAGARTRPILHMPRRPRARRLRQTQGALRKTKHNRRPLPIRKNRTHRHATQPQRPEVRTRPMQTMPRRENRQNKTSRLQHQTVKNDRQHPGGVFLCFCQLLGELTCRDSGWLSWARFALPVASGVLSRVARFRLRGLVPGRGFRF